MKIISIERNVADALSQWPEVTTYPDSALLRDGRILYLPELDGQWSATVYPVVRISRLSKSIAEKFASRYYDAMTLALRINPAQRWRGSALSHCFDGAWVVGDWVDLPLTPCAITVDNRTTAVDTSLWLADRTISVISRHITLKNGDEIALCRLTEVPIAIDTQFSASIDDRQVLNFKIR